MRRLVPGLRELARMVGRQTSRVRLVLERRKLARLETALGLLGWQQADYDGVTQEQVDRVTHYERQQARITNESATLGLEIQEVEERRGVAEREFEEAQAVALEKEYPAATNLEVLETLVGAKRKERREIEARLPVLDRELAAAEERYRTLVLPGHSSGEAQAPLLQLRKMILALPKEKADWAARLHRISEELGTMENLLEALREARKRFEKRDEALADEIATRQRAKRKVEKEIEALEKEKAAPFREIGRVLADQKIGPLNQPEALAAVLTQRKKVAGLEAGIAASLAVSKGSPANVGE